MTVEFIHSTGAGNSKKITREGTFNKVVAITSNVVVTMEGSDITGGGDITFPRNFKVEGFMSRVVVSNGTIALYTP